MKISSFPLYSMTGKGMGALVTGQFYQKCGPEVVWPTYASLCFLVLLIYMFINIFVFKGESNEGFQHQQI